MLPTENIYWRDIPTDAMVELRGLVYVVSWKAVDAPKTAVAYWEGREAKEAQRFLDKLVEASKKE